MVRDADHRRHHADGRDQRRFHADARARCEVPGARDAGAGDAVISPAWCKMDAGLDSNRKVMQAGRNGRDVFLFLLRRCSWNNAPGRLKLTEIDPWFVVQVEKMMTEAEVVEGTERAIAAGLIEIADGMVWIVGWEEEWGKRPQTATERKQKERAIKKTTAAEKQMQLTDVTTMSQRSRREREQIRDQEHTRFGL